MLKIPSCLASGTCLYLPWIAEILLLLRARARLLPQFQLQPSLGQVALPHRALQGVAVVAAEAGGTVACIPAVGVVEVEAYTA